VIHLVTTANSHLYSEEIRQLHRVRKSVFVDELGWKLAVIDGSEFDEYDDKRACNVVGFSANGEAVMGLRFRPADDRSMLVDHFSHVLPRGVRPIDDGRTWELSRGFCIERGVRKHHLRRKAACMIAPLEIALQAGIDRCVGFTDVRMLSFCYGVGWKMTLLGSPVNYGEGDAVAYEVEVSHAALADMRRMWGLPEPAFVEINELLPGDGDVHRAADRLMLQAPELRKLAADPEAPALAPPPVDAASRAESYYAVFQR
jgi:acyl homoserine lactone synthase